MNSIDPTDYVEVEEGISSLRFNNEKQQAKFELGVCMAVYKWDELNTAVENSWGGSNSGEKRDWISGIIIDLFEEKVVDVQLIEETLLYAMVDEFDTEVDNDSALEIAALVIKIYRSVALTKYEIVDELYSRWQERKNNNSNGQTNVVINPDPNNPDSSDDEVEGDETNSIAFEENADGMDVDEPSGPIIDEDGFEMVQNKGRRGRR